MENEKLLGLIGGILMVDMFYKITFTSKPVFIVSINYP